VFCNRGMPHLLRCIGQRRGGICHRRANSIVCAVDQIVQISGDDGPEYRSLGCGILFAEYIQRPFFNGRTSEVRVMETWSKTGLEREWREPCCSLFRPAQSP
jgi:hypothetical protein